MDGYDCYFENGKCEIQFNNKFVGLVFQQDKLYLLSPLKCVAKERQH